MIITLGTQNSGAEFDIFKIKYFKILGKLDIYLPHGS